MLSSVSAAPLTYAVTPKHEDEPRLCVTPAPRAVGDPRIGAPHGDHPRVSPGQGNQGRAAGGLFRGPAGHRLEVRQTTRDQPAFELG